MKIRFVIRITAKPITTISPPKSQYFFLSKEVFVSAPTTFTCANVFSDNSITISGTSIRAMQIIAKPFNTSCAKKIVLEALIGCAPSAKSSPLLYARVCSKYFTASVTDRTEIWLVACCSGLKQTTRAARPSIAACSASLSVMLICVKPPNCSPVAATSSIAYQVSAVTVSSECQDSSVVSAAG